MAVWGYTGVFWGDIGRWSHEVERFAAGELPYRDYNWHYPPLGLWVEGGMARIFGAELTQLSLVSTALSAILVVAYVRFSREVLQRTDAWLVGVGLVLAVAYAQTMGAPLPLGLYSPASLVGAVCIAGAVMFFLQARAEAASASSWWMAVCAALAVLSKQDFWLPAAYLVGATTLHERRLGPALLAGGITAAGVAIIAATAGIDILVPLAGGFGHAALVGGQGFPSWERLTVDVFTIALICGAFMLLLSLVERRIRWRPLIVAGVVAVLAGSLHVTASMTTTLPAAGSYLTPTQDAIAASLRADDPLLRPALKWLVRRVSRAPIPVLLAPLLLLLMALRWRRLSAPRRTTLAILLGLAIAFRGRRGFEGTEWFEFLFTLPVVLASAELLSSTSQASVVRLRRSTVAVLATFAVWAYGTLGRGPGTRREYPDVAVTLRGPVHWKPAELRDYERILHAVDSLDPGRTRPVFAFGYSGGFNYFLMRRNPFPFTQDFYFSGFPADSVLRHRPPGILLIDNPAVRGISFGAADFEWDQWEQSRVPGPYDEYDRSRFDSLRAGCPEVPMDDTMFSLYACS